MHLDNLPKIKHKQANNFFLLAGPCAIEGEGRLQELDKAILKFWNPQVEVKTSEARAILPKEVPLTNAIEQWANVGSLVHGLHTSDYALISSALKDVIVEPYRKKLIPHFDDVRSTALRAGALGVGISGSGPSIFVLSKGEIIADKIAQDLFAIYQKFDIDFNIYISPINKQGIKIL